MNKIKIEISGKITKKGKTEYLSFGIYNEEDKFTILEKLKKEKPDWLFSIKEVKADW